jgi:predicted RNA-binding Zn-ribbon protein involved in translation (DUF1610 family)
MTRRLLNLLTLVSLLLCVAAVALWAQSDAITRWWEYSWFSTNPNRRQTDLSVGVGGGHVILGVVLVSEAPGSASLPTTGSNWRRDADDPEDVAERIPGSRFGFGYARREGQGMSRVIASRAWDVAFPLWAAALLSAVLPAVWIRYTYRHRRTISRGLCPNCGYDLRASTTRCPECGTVVVAGSV